MRVVYVVNEDRPGLLWAIQYDGKTATGYEWRWDSRSEQWIELPEARAIYWKLMLEPGYEETSHPAHVLPAHLADYTID